ncbi:MFS monocarboxylate [Verticillium dahliae]
MDYSGDANRWGLIAKSCLICAANTEYDTAIENLEGVMGGWVYRTMKYVTVILAAFMINSTACGILFGFGVYQEHYETMVLQEGSPFTGASSATIDLIGTLSASLMTITAPFVMAWVKYFKPQYGLWAGGILFGVASVLANFGKVLWHFQLAQGLLLGIATGLSLVPSMTIAPTWFEKRRGLAMGFISAGTGIGGLVWAPTISACIENIGFRNTLRLTACLATTIICISGSFLDWEPSMANHLAAKNEALSPVTALFKIPLPDWQTVKQPKFILQAASTIFQSTAYYTPVFFTVLYAKSLGYDEREGANLTALSNACNAVGKIAVGFISDRVRRLNSFFLTTLLTAIFSLGLWVPSTLIGTVNEPTAKNLFISFTVLYGLFASASISLFPVALIELFGVKEIPRMGGVFYMLHGLATLVGTPVAGVLVQGHDVLRDANSYTTNQFW